MARVHRTKGSKYRSGTEQRVAASLRQSKVPFEYETEKIPYTITLEYKPDFIIKTKSGKKIYIEVKGEWDSSDRRKHLALKQQHPELDIRFLFANPNARIRAGSKTRYRDVCEGRGLREFKGVTWKYADARTKPIVPKEWLEE